ncbi:MAG: helicase-related protein [Clostridia bacterium]|nr:helicase-related protein [Clostridia bacterium]
MSNKSTAGPRRRVAKQKNKKSASRLYTPEDLRSLYGLAPSVIQRYFPEPFTRRYGKGGDSPAWTSSQVTRALEHPKVRLAMDRARQKQLRAAEEEEKIRDFLLGFDVEKLRREAETLSRRFVLHIGPTNSGKTYQAMQALKQARAGVYLGPLRLLALEMYETMNRDGVPCSLLTGEESVLCPGALHTASTIELADFGARYDVAVIDEAQMIADPFRGDKWFRALYCLRADEIHVCLAPEAQELIIRMLESFGAPYTVMKHKRLAPLSYTGVFEDLKNVQPGDALIVFSRKAVLAVSAELERAGKHASVIYGALPPVSRREEVRRFSEHETDVVVATDAIGMGIALRGLHRRHRHGSEPADPADHLLRDKQIRRQEPPAPPHR